LFVIYKLLLEDVKSFITLALGINVIKLFFV